MQFHHGSYIIQYYIYFKRQIKAICICFHLMSIKNNAKSFYRNFLHYFLKVTFKHCSCPNCSAKERRINWRRCINQNKCINSSTYVKLLGSVNIYLSLFFSRCNIVPFKNSTPSLILQFLNTKSSNIQDKL